MCDLSNFPNLLNNKTKVFLEHPFPRRQQKAKRCKAKQQNKKNQSKKRFQKLTYFEM